jgi:hypothetical protein
MNTDKRKKMQNKALIETNRNVDLLCFSGVLDFLISVYLRASVVSNSVHQT